MTTYNLDQLGPVLVVGDVHGSFDELMQLFDKTRRAVGAFTPIFVGDLFDRATGHEDLVPWVIKNLPISVCGNHDDKLTRWLKGNPVRLSNGLSVTTSHLERNSLQQAPLLQWLEGLPYFIELQTQDKKVYIVHAALEPRYVKEYPTAEGKFKKLIETRCLYGYTDGTRDEFGYMKRLPFGDKWNDEDHMCYVIHGHQVFPDVNTEGDLKNVIGIDQGCVFGGKLTGLYIPPEGIQHGAFFQVKSGQTYGQDHYGFREAGDVSEEDNTGLDSGGEG